MLSANAKSQLAKTPTDVKKQYQTAPLASFSKPEAKYDVSVKHIQPASGSIGPSKSCHTYPEAFTAWTDDHSRLNSRDWPVCWTTLEYEAKVGDLEAVQDTRLEVFSIVHIM